jgi:KDO2-lipid IV(A) lauroyltransferase
VFLNLGQNMMEWLLLPKLSMGEIQRMITSQGVEHLRQALSQGNGAIIVTAHFGNWELIPLYLKSLGFEGGVLARRLRYPEYESFLITMRGARGVPTFARGSVKAVAKLLRANQIVGMLPDQDVDSLEGVFVNFFGHPAYTPLGPAALSLTTGAPILPCFIIREGARFRLVIEPSLYAPQTTDRTQAMRVLTQTWSDVVESYIRHYPDHWVWMHRRWKTQPNPAYSDQGSAVSPQREGARIREPHAVLSWLLAAGCWLLAAGLAGCGKSPGAKVDQGAGTATSAAIPDPNAAQQMGGFTLTGYEENGAKRWELSGKGASMDGNIVTIHQPDAVGHDLERTAYLTASVAQVNQQDRHVRMEHEVTIHTSDGLWFSSPVLHWIPDQNQMATDAPVRIETDHMLLRGRGASGLTQLKHATIFQDIELVLNPSNHDLPGGGSKQVTITCDGPLFFDYEHHVATFEQNVHVQDPSGDLYSDKLVAYLDQKTHTIRYAEAIGRVRIHQDQNTALSDRAIYEPAISKITLVGKPSLLIYASQGSEGTQLSFGGLAATSNNASRMPVHGNGADTTDGP